MKLSFKNAVLVSVGCVVSAVSLWIPFYYCVVSVGCVVSAVSLWIPFYYCENHAMCGDGMHSAVIPLIISVSTLAMGVYLISTGLLEGKEEGLK